MQSNENSSKLSKTQSRFTSVRDLNKSFYQQLSNQPMPNILHDMLKSSPLQTSPCPNAGQRPLILSLSVLHLWISSAEKICSTTCRNQVSSNEFDPIADSEVISSKFSEQLKTVDRSSPLFRRMVLTMMRHQMNKSKLNASREEILSTPPPTSLEQCQFSSNATFDLDIEPLLDFPRTTFEDFQPLPHFWTLLSFCTSGDLTLSLSRSLWLFLYIDHVPSFASPSFHRVNDRNTHSILVTTQLFLSRVRMSAWGIRYRSDISLPAPRDKVVATLDTLTLAWGSVGTQIELL